jgi:hypothetical protein
MDTAEALLIFLLFTDGAFDEPQKKRGQTRVANN